MQDTDGSLDALVWSEAYRHQAISDLDATLRLRMLDIGQLGAPMAQPLRLPIPRPQVPTGDYMSPGLRSIGAPNLLMCRQGRLGMVAADGGRTRSRRAATGAPYVRGLQYLDPPSMIQTGLIPLHPGAINASESSTPEPPPRPPLRPQRRAPPMVLLSMLTTRRFFGC